MVQGQKLTAPPVFDGDRVSAFTAEAASGSSVSYSWLATELKPGTYLYNSGSHAAQQVHMGLYGALVVDADATGCASGLAAYPGVCYDRDIVVIYSEVDPALHNDRSPRPPRPSTTNPSTSSSTVIRQAPAS